MSIFDTVTIVAAAFLDGWFINSLLRLEVEGNRWPLIRRYLFTTFCYALLLMGIVWLSFGRSHFWRELIVDSCIASAGAAIIVRRAEHMKRFHVPARRGRRNLMA